MPRSPAQTGILYALAAYTAWGVFPVYWKFLAHVPVTTVLAHRVVWAFVFYFGLLKVTQGKALGPLIEGLAQKWKIFACGSLIGVNWGIYVWAVQAGHVVESALGYYISPLLNVVLGAVFLGEKLTIRQKVAFAFALVGVCIMTFGTVRGFPWIAVSLALTFGFYGMIRKTLPLKTLVGSTLETFVMLAPALAVVFGAGFATSSSTDVSYGLGTWLLLILGGAVTGIPLLWFSEAAKRLPLSELAFFQYLAPTLQFLCGVFLFREEFSNVHALAFLFIWLGIGLQLAGMASKGIRDHRSRRS